MTKKAKRKFTVAEFKTWLEGIMEFQDDDWSPNRDQWNEIYDKIMHLKEPVSNNKEKVSLTDATLDEINGIVYEQINHGVSKMMAPQQIPPQPQPQPQLQQPQQIDQSQDMPLNNPPPVNSNGLEDVSLSELNKKFKEQHEQTTPKHKLPDVNGVPEDFV